MKGRKRNSLRGPEDRLIKKAKSKDQNLEDILSQSEPFQLAAALLDCKDEEAKAELRSLQHDQLALLGAVSDHPLRYFDISRDSIACAKLFFSEFFTEYKAVLLSKYSKEAKEAEIAQVKKVRFPGVISFVTASINDKKVCFIFKSPNKIQVNPQISATIDRLNKKAQQYEFIFITTGVNYKKYQQYLTLASSLLLKKTLNDVEIGRPCVEKIFIPFLMHLYATYGKKLRVTGALNCLFFPYSNKDMRNVNDQYRIRQFFSSLESKKSEEVLNLEFLGLNNILYRDAKGEQQSCRILEVPCCGVCTMLRDINLALLSLAQMNPQGRMLLQKNKLYNEPGRSVLADFLKRCEDMGTKQAYQDDLMSFNESEVKEEQVAVELAVKAQPAEEKQAVPDADLSKPPLVIEHHHFHYYLFPGVNTSRHRQVLNDPMHPSNPFFEKNNQLQVKK
jgi:hypothetical protein